MFSRRQFTFVVLAVVLLIQTAFAVPIINIGGSDLQKLSATKTSEDVVTTRTPDGGKRVMIVVRGRTGTDGAGSLPASLLKYTPFTSVWPFTLNKNEAPTLQMASDTKERDSSSISEAIVKDVENIIRNVQSTTQYKSMQNDGLIDFKGVTSVDSGLKVPSGLRMKMKIQSNTHSVPSWGQYVDSPYFLLATGFILCLTIFITLTACCNIACNMRPTKKGDIVIDFWVAKLDEDLHDLEALKAKSGAFHKVNTVSV